MKGKTQLKEDKTVAWLLLAYAIVLITFCSTFSPIFGFNNWPDINVYHNIGKAMMNGQILYKDIFDHKGPCVFLLYGFASLFPGKYFIGAFLFEIVFLFVSLWFSYKIACLYLDRVMSFFVTLLFAFFPLIHSGAGGSAEEIALPFILISFYFLLKYLKDGAVHDPFWMLIHGIMFSFVFLIKINLIAFWIFVPALFLYFLLKGEYHLIVRNLITCLLGIFLIATPTFFYFYFTNSLYDTYHSYIDFNLLYARPSIDADFIVGLGGRFIDLVTSHYLLMTAIMIGLVFFIIAKKFVFAWTGKLILIITFVGTFAAVFASQAIIGSYFYIPLSIFALLGIVVLINYLARIVESPKFAIVYSAGSVVAIASVVAIFFIKKETLSIYSDKEFVNSFASEILKEEPKDRTLFCLGLNHGVCLFTEADIIPTVKYFFTPNIRKDRYPAISDAQRAYIENKALNFVVVKNGYRDYDSLLPYLNENYEIIKTYPMEGQVYYLYKRKA